MKFNLNTHKLATKYIILAVVGGCILISGYLTYALKPLQVIVDELVTMRPGSFLFKLWSHPPFEVLFKVYIFNVTNSEQFLVGKEKLNVSEVGPYVYQEILTNTEGQFNENNTLTFKPRRELILRKDLSQLDPMNSWIITPNIPLLGISSYLKDNHGYFTNFGFASVANMIDSPPVKNVSAQDYLFGYEDRLVSLANTYVSSWIDFSKFGILDRMMALDKTNNTVTIHLPKNIANSTNDKGTPLAYSINTFNGSPGLKQWGYDESEDSRNSPCNIVEGAFDAALFPRHLKENTTLPLYRKAFCRPVAMIYENTNFTSDGLKYYNYRIDQNFLSRSEENSNNECYCKNSNDCLPKGFGNMAPCYYGMPVIMSQPHFLNTDPKVSTLINGLSPNKEKHDTVMKVDPNFGIPLSASLRMQANLKVSSGQFIMNSKSFNGMIIPLLWIELEVNEIPVFVKILLKIGNAVPTIEIAIACIFGILGIFLVAISWLCIYYFSSHRNSEDSCNNRNGYSPILMLPLRLVGADIKRIS